MISKESDLDILMNEYKTKFDSATYKKIQILTLKPASWTSEKTSKFFNKSNMLFIKQLIEEKRWNFVSAN